MPIVNVNVYETQAPAPLLLQKTGAFLSQGGTITAAGTRTLLTQPADLTPILTTPLAVTSITQTTGTATVTLPVPHGIPSSSTATVTIAGANQAAYNGTFLVTVTGTSAFTFSVPSGTVTPATGTMTWVPDSAAEIFEMVTTYFAQGNANAVYVLELGPGSVSAGCTFLQAWIVLNPGVNYVYLVPRTWDGVAAFYSTLLALYTSTVARTYFFTTTTLQNWSLYVGKKDVVAMVEAPVSAGYNANALTAITYSGGLVTATTTTAHSVPVGAWFQIAGVTPTGYNGYFKALVGTTGSTLVYAVAADPGSETVLGTLVASGFVGTGVTATEFSLASFFYRMLNTNTTGIVSPFIYNFLYGVTQFPTQGYGSIIAAMTNAGVNLVGSAAEGGLSNNMLLYGTTMDGNPFTFWYAADYIALGIQQTIANAIINSYNNGSPIFYRQDGINTLQATGATFLSSSIAAGLAFGTLIQTELDPVTFATNLANGVYNGYVVINAVPFATYVLQNPSAYQEEQYGGYTVSFAPQYGFKNITFNLDATQFV